MGILINKRKWILIIILILIFFSIFHISTNKLINEKNKNYPLINNNSAFSGKIENVYLNRGSIYLMLTNKKCFRTTDSRNYDYNPIFIDDFLSYGDSIVKPLNTDTLFIIRDTRKYYFVLGKFINEKHKD